MTDVMEQEDEYGGGTTDEYDPEEDTKPNQNVEEGEQGEAGPEEKQEEGEEEEEEEEEGGIEQDVEQETGKHRRKRHRSSQEDPEGNHYGDLRRRGHRSHDSEYKKFKHSGSDRSEGEQDSQQYPGGDYSDQEELHEKERRRHRRSEDRGKHRRHGRRRKDKSKSKVRLDDSRSSQDMEAEDGEILEDGEIEEEGEEGGDIREENHRNGSRMEHHGSRRKYDRDGGKSGDNRRDGDYQDDDFEEGGSDQDKGHPRERHDNRRPHPRRDRHGRDRERRDRRGRRDEKQQRNKGKRSSKYHDYDNVDDENQQAWMSHKKNSSGSHKHDYDSQNYGGGDRRGDRFESPPGPYDSPSDEDEGYNGHHERSKKNKSMLSLVGDNMLDPNIAAEEGQEIYKKPPPKKKRNFDRDGRGGGHNNHDKGNNKRKMQSRDHNPDQPKKKPLLKTPMEERPICRFYKEGKCQKGSDCPFNHEKMPKKPELCKYYLNSYCSKEDNCIFMHNILSKISKNIKKKEKKKDVLKVLFFTCKGLICIKKKNPNVVVCSIP